MPCAVRKSDECRVLRYDLHRHREGLGHGLPNTPILRPRANLAFVRTHTIRHRTINNFALSCIFVLTALVGACLLSCTRKTGVQAADRINRARNPLDYGWQAPLYKPGPFIDIVNSGHGMLWRALLTR